jgi:broad specificity phosphatase PhoE
MRRAPNVRRTAAPSPEGTLGVEITVVRHGETAANLAGVWQGWSNAGFSARGREQVKRLAARLEGREYDLVVSSDLGRAMATAGALRRDVESDRRWREINLGSWEGLSQDEIGMNHPDVAAALERGDDIAFGGGERLTDLLARVEDAFSDLVDRLDDGGKALVVSHGGAIFGLLALVLGVNTRHKLLRLTNTSLTTITVDQSGRRLSVFNDATHLPGSPVRAEAGATHVMVFRHGETQANVEQRWQGQQPGSLTDAGRDQARRLGAHVGPFDALYTSPLERARETAALINGGGDLAIEEIESLQEIGFGTWENLTYDEIMAIDPGGLTAMLDGQDLRRGGTGETLAEVRDRMTGTLRDLADRHRAGTIGVVSHGGATRAFATGILGIDVAHRHRLPVMDNTGIAHFVFGERGLAIGAWNLTPHLRG